MAALDTPNGATGSYAASPAVSVDPSFQARPVGEQTGHCTVASIALVIPCVATVIAAGAFCRFTWLLAQDLLAYWRL